MHIQDYVNQVIEHLDERATEISRAAVVELYERSEILLTNNEWMLSDNERGYLTDKIQSKAIPQPKILIKDHKKKGSDGNYPSRLVVPATNFTAGFSQLGYLGIKCILDSNKVKYNQREIIQASDLKGQVEHMSINASNSTIATVDAVSMYPSIKFSLIEKAVEHYSKSLDEDDLTKIRACLKFLEFGMSSTLITFKNKYYMYDGDKSLDDKGLTIGGYESAWLADLAMSFLLDTIDQSLIEPLNYFGIYRDDGLAIFPGIKSAHEIDNWLTEFQNSVNAQAGNDKLQFTSEVWKPGHDDNKLGDTTTTIISKPSLPFLNMELFWDENNDLKFCIHVKPNQEIKYLNAGSSHTPDCFKAINKGVCHRLTMLTSTTPTNANSPLSEIYPRHFDALEKAGLLQPGETSPTLSECRKSIDDSKSSLTSNKLRKRRARDRKRAIYFMVGSRTSGVSQFTSSSIRSRKPSLHSSGYAFRCPTTDFKTYENSSKAI